MWWCELLLGLAFWVVGAQMGLRTCILLGGRSCHQGLRHELCVSFVPVFVLLKHIAGSTGHQALLIHSALLSTHDMVCVCGCG